MKIAVVERKLGREAALGQIWYDAHLIEIDPRLTEKERLATLLHELFHHIEPKRSERTTLRFERAACKVLWEDGWRRLQPKPNNKKKTKKQKTKK